MTPRTGRALRMAYLVAGVAGVVFFVMSVGLLGVWPGRALEAQTRAMSPPHPLGMSPSEQRGRVIYSREGCAYCHSQQVRYVSADMARFGAPTLAWETRLDYPHLWGTRRIGPDLAREGAARSTDWHLAHLFAPRAVVPSSVMPAYPTLFDGSADRPRQEARDLVAYLDTLGRAREIAGPEGEAHARAACNCADDGMALMAFHSPLNAHPARTRRKGDIPALPPDRDPGRGRRLYADHCASCHGATGRADGPGARALSPRPSNLADHEYRGDRLAQALWNGVAGTAMPAWRDHQLADLASLAEAVRQLSTVRADTAASDDIRELGARVYAANCVQCHGERGGGDGTAAAELPMAPTNFRWQRPSLAQSLSALRNGVEGTPMAPWTARLNDDELLAAAYYVRGFFEGDQVSPGGSGR